MGFCTCLVVSESVDGVVIVFKLGKVVVVTGVEGCEGHLLLQIWDWDFTSKFWVYLFDGCQLEMIANWRRS